MTSQLAWKTALSVAFETSEGVNEDEFYMCALFLCDREENEDQVQWYPVAVTEKLPITKEIRFNTQFQVYFRFEEKTPLKFVIYKLNEIKIDTSNEKQPTARLYEKQRVAFGVRPLGIPSPDRVVAESLSEIITSPNRCNQFGVTNGSEEIGNISVELKDCSFDRYNLHLQFRAKKLPAAAAFSKQASTLQIWSQTQASGDWVKVAESHPVDSVNPIWGLMECTLRELCDGEHTECCVRIDVEVGSRVVGSVHTSVQKLLDEEEYFLTCEKTEKGVNLGVVQLVYYDLHIKPSFLDYISNLWEINLLTAIDFTASNGNPNTTQSLHYVNNEAKNEYEKAIIAFGDVLATYNSFKLISLYGYGALLPGTAVVSNIFPLNHNPNNAEVYGVRGVLECYYETLRSVVLKGPTVFSEIVKEAMRQSKEATDNKQKKYHVLLIITDGVIFDWRDTVDALVASSSFPLSVIIVGVGNSDFGTMLSLNEFPILSSIKTPSSRKNIQFIPPHPLKEGEKIEQFYTEALRAIPRQMTEYLHDNNIQTEVDEKEVINLRSSPSPKRLEIQKLPEWEADERVKECTLCGAPFSFLTRKHHCRLCGKIVCAACSTNSAPIPVLHLMAPQRCCDICYALLLRSQ